MAGESARGDGLLGYERDHLARVRAGLAECMVLLRKDGAFPLSGPCKLAAFGNGVRHGVKGGTGSGDVNAHVVVGIERGLLDAGFELTSEVVDVKEEAREVLGVIPDYQLDTILAVCGYNPEDFAEDALGTVMKIRNIYESLRAIKNANV